MVKFTGQVLVYLFLRLVGGGERYLRLCLLWDEPEEPVPALMQIVRCAERRYGKRGVTAANMALGLPTLAVLTAGDLLTVRFHGALPRVFIRLSWFAVCLGAFDLFRRPGRPERICIAYLAISLLLASYWALTGLFVLIFQNIVYRNEGNHLCISSTNSLMKPPPS